MNKTKIEWVRNPDGTQGYTWNPITGCLNGCEYCYARKLANGRLKQRYLANKNVSPIRLMRNEDIISGHIPANDPFYPRFWPENLDQILHRRIDSELKGVFCCNMSDLFGIGVPEDWTRQVLGAIEINFYDRFYLLTKQAQNLAKFSPFPNNCWVGVTACDAKMATEALEGLTDIKATVKYMSLEPLQDRILFTTSFLEHLDWLIIGSQTKPYNPPKIEWVREIVEAADKAGVPVFLKDNLRSLLMNKRGINLYKWAVKNDEYFRLRQEMPQGE